MPEWIAIFLTALFAVLSAIYSYAKREGMMEATRKAMDERFNAMSLTLSSIVDVVQEHRNDTEIHWNSRQRDDLADRMKNLQDSVNLLIQRSAHKYDA